ncbi:Lsr2 dimerization domain-containing protein, partial [Pseudonocardia asaccharolytica]
MVQIQEVRLVDDLTGEQADETVVFGLDGKGYEIDLSKAHAESLRNVLAEFVAAARRADGGRRGRRASAGRRTAAGPDGGAP